MEFEEMKKIWDEQNKQTMYAIDEKTLYKRIKSKSKRASRTANMNELGLMAIATLTATILLLFKDGSLYNSLTSIAMILMGIYVLIGRLRRLQKDRQFDRSMLGELDRAISNIDNEAFRARTFVWWMIVPILVPLFIIMAKNEASLWQIGVIVIASILGFLVTRWDLKKVQLPRKKELELLREKLLTD